jgi:hypothetical protein
MSPAVGAEAEDPKNCVLQSTLVARNGGFERLLAIVAYGQRRAVLELHANADAKRPFRLVIELQSLEILAECSGDFAKRDRLRVFKLILRPKRVRRTCVSTVRAMAGEILACETRSWLDLEVSLALGDRAFSAEVAILVSGNRNPYSVPQAIHVIESE